MQICAPGSWMMHTFTGSLGHNNAWELHVSVLLRVGWCAEALHWDTKLFSLKEKRRPELVSRLHNAPVFSWDLLICLFESQRDPPRLLPSEFGSKSLNLLFMRLREQGSPNIRHPPASSLSRDNSLSPNSQQPDSFTLLLSQLGKIWPKALMLTPFITWSEMYFL